MNTTHQELYQELKSFIIETMNLEDITPAEIGDDTLLFADDGLALDSIDALELVLALKKKYGEHIEIDVFSGSDMPADLEKYDLAIHCGGCMFNRAHVLSRIEKLKAAGVPVTNYGLFFANESGILDRVTI